MTILLNETGRVNEKDNIDVSQLGNYRSVT